MDIDVEIAIPVERSSVSRVASYRGERIMLRDLLNALGLGDWLSVQEAGR